MSNDSLSNGKNSQAAYPATQIDTIKGILFDKDGTLIDFNQTWLPLYRHAAELLASRAGKPGHGEKLMAAGGYVAADESWLPDSVLASGSNDQILSFWLDELGSPQLANDSGLCKEYTDIFQLKANGYRSVIADLDGFLAHLQAHGLTLGVATMDDEANAISTLEGMACRQRFDFVCGADSGFGVKPEPGMIGAFAQSTGLATNAIMMVGDSPRDLRMGRNAGAGMTVGVLTGATRAEHLMPLADRVYDDISGILEMFDCQSD